MDHQTQLTEYIDMLTKRRKLHLDINQNHNASKWMRKDAGATANTLSEVIQELTEILSASEHQPVQGNEQAKEDFWCDNEDYGSGVKCLKKCNACELK